MMNGKSAPARKRVLVVEDDEVIRMVVAAELEALGHEVVQAANGVEALAAVERSRPNLILLDMRMPILDGWGFATELRRRHGRVSPIVVMTAAADVRERALEIGANAWIGKPFDLNALTTLVTRELS